MPWLIFHMEPKWKFCSLTNNFFVWYIHMTSTRLYTYIHVYNQWQKDAWMNSDTRIYTCKLFSLPRECTHTPTRTYLAIISFFFCSNTAFSIASVVGTGTCATKLSSLSLFSVYKDRNKCKPEGERAHVYMCMQKRVGCDTCGHLQGNSKCATKNAHFLCTCAETNVRPKKRVFVCWLVCSCSDKKKHLACA